MRYFGLAISLLILSGCALFLSQEQNAERIRRNEAEKRVRLISTDYASNCEQVGVDEVNDVDDAKQQTVKHNGNAFAIVGWHGRKMMVLSYACSAPIPPGVPEPNLLKNAKNM